MIYHSVFYDLTRFIVGVILLMEGIRLVGDSSTLFGIVDRSRIGGLAFILEHHVIFTLIAGGILIAIGLLTRIAILFELLIFIGVLFNHDAQFGLYSVYGNVAFSLVITLVLIVIFLAGSGTISADHYLKKK